MHFSLPGKLKILIPLLFLLAIIIVISIVKYQSNQKRRTSTTSEPTFVPKELIFNREIDDYYEFKEMEQKGAVSFTKTRKEKLQELTGNEEATRPATELSGTKDATHSATASS